MAVRNCAEIGENLQKILRKLLKNQNLLKLLYYTGDDPLNCKDLTDEIISNKIIGKLIRITPRLLPYEEDQSCISLIANNASTLFENGEFRTVTITVEVFVPITKWMINDTNLRPYAILGEVQKSLNGLTINGMGKMVGGDFFYDFGSDEMTAFVQTFYINTYD